MNNIEFEIATLKGEINTLKESSAKQTTDLLTAQTTIQTLEQEIKDIKASVASFYYNQKIINLRQK